MIQGLLVAVLIGAILVVLPTIPFPDVPEAAYTSVTQFFQFLWSFNLYIPIDQLFLAGSIVLTIEILMQGLRLLSRIITFFTGRRSPLDDLGNDDTISRSEH